MNNPLIKLDITSFDITKSEKDDQHYFIKGYASVPTVDDDKEKVLTEGLDITPFKKYGVFNWEHKNEPEYILGIPIPEKCFVSKAGFYTEGKLFKSNPKVQALWNIFNETKDLNRNIIGMSIEGFITERDKNNPKIIKKAVVKNVALSHRPVNKSTLPTVEMFVKSIVDQMPWEQSGYQDAVNENIRREDLEGGIKYQIWIDKDKNKVIETNDLYTYIVTYLSVYKNVPFDKAKKIADILINKLGI